MFCKNCGKEIEDNSKFCQFCSKEIETDSLQNSGSNNDTNELPKEYQRFNWGAFLFTFIWGICNKTYIALLIIPIAFIPVVNAIGGLILAIYLGINGNKLAWKNKKWKNLEEFNLVQRKWATVGVAIICFILFIAILAGISSSDIPTNNDISSYSSEGIKIEHKKDLELVESHFCNKEYGLKSVCGTIRNNSNRTYSYVGINISLYDSNGNRIGDTLENILNLKGNTNWKFDAPIMETNVARYEITNIDGY